MQTLLPPGRLSLALVALTALGGCRHDYRDARSDRADRADAIEGCAERLPVFAANALPQQPYRVIAPVDAFWGITSTARFLHMKRRACELGADALIDADDGRSGPVSTTTVQYDAAGHPISIVQTQPARPRRSAGLAIQFLVPQVAVAAPPPIQVVVPPPVQIIVPRGACPASTETCGPACCDSATSACDRTTNTCIPRF
jgi:hypothetical protein